MKCPRCCSIILTGSQICPKCNYVILKDNSPISLLTKGRNLISSYHSITTIKDSKGFSKGKLEEREGKWSVGEKILNRYEIVKLLGEGGMGEVYMSIDNLLERRVAIKRTIPFIEGRQNAVRRLFIEARSLASINHPNVVHIYDIIEYLGNICIIMEYIEGKSLSELVITYQKLSIYDGLVIIKQVAEGVKGIHSEGIIHRDIKPSNIIIDKWGIPKLVDFGLAKVLPKDKEITISGTAIGTWEYASPEQMRDAKRVDERTDIYSLGATLYYLISGDSPQYFREGKLPNKIRELLLISMAHDPDERYQSIDDFITALEDVKNYYDNNKEMI